MRYDAEHKEKTRARVLKEAAKAIRAEGPHRIAVAGVMASAGLTHGGFYAHFRSKDDLVAAAVELMFIDAKTRFAKETGDRPPAEGLSAYIDFYLSPRHRDARATGCPVTALAADLPRLEGDVRAQYGLGVERLAGRIAGQLAELGREDADALGRSVLAELVGALSLSRAVADAEQSDRILETSRAALKQRLGLETAQ
jgi:TetR/AcrR family transcriptional repressor of nem operon